MKKGMPQIVHLIMRRHRLPLCKAFYFSPVNKNILRCYFARLWFFIEKRSHPKHLSFETAPSDTVVFSSHRFVFQVCAGELAVVQVGVEAALLQQLLVVALFYDTPVIHDQNHFGVAYG